MVSDPASGFLASDASSRALCNLCCMVSQISLSVLDHRLALLEIPGINVLGCLFQFLKESCIYPRNGSSYGHMPRSKANLPNNRSEMLPLHCSMKSSRYRCKHSGMQHILSTTAEQRLPIFDIY